VVLFINTEGTANQQNCSRWCKLGYFLFAVVECSTFHRLLQQRFVSTHANEKQLVMILIYDECRRIAVPASQLHSKRYPARSTPSTHKYVTFVKSLGNRSWNTSNRRRSRSVMHGAHEVDILAAIANNSHSSIMRRHDILQSVVQLSVASVKAINFTNTTFHCIKNNTNMTSTPASTSVSFKLIRCRIITLSKRSAYWWSLLYKLCSSQFEQHALLVCWKRSLASASGPSTAMQSKRMVR
jgi:hypothetical protein